MAKKLLTEADKEALSMMPSDGWFTFWDVPSSLNRPQYRLERLEAVGGLSHLCVPYPAIN
ncbi:hypothetical protein [Photorhabdus aegyptia]|uniref:Uncharacterized protein n=1 Tax=Photorhabdus aegyptia TaxID=2805098 RepID=A0A022PDK7_9GAMM|nr:hypothetical protein [Photorhabdus aegyptia]EYU13629.1 hypothetical protein BA1DRAFT_03874 [Photorhabdus aegyptia]